MKTLKYIIFLMLLTFSLGAQQITKPTMGNFLLKGGTLHTVTNGNLMADLLISNGKITSIGENLGAGDATVIDCSGMHIFPGFIDGGTRLGTSEIGAVSLTNDYNELGDFIPHMKALTAVNPNSVAIPVTRTNGVTSVITAPAGGLFPGTASLINLHGYTPEQMHAGFDAIVVNYPRSGRRGRWDRRSDEDIKKAEEKALEKLNDVMKKVRLYAKIDSAGMAMGKDHNDYNPQMEALLPVIKGEMPLMIEVNEAKSIESAIKWVEEQEIKAILTGVSEGYKVAEKIAKSGLSVVTGPVLTLPSRDSEKYDSGYTNAAKMVKAGVKVALRTADSENVRNLPFNAGFAVAYGMEMEEAVKAITLNPAEIFGVSDMYGSLDEGKIANLFVSDGDPFETKSDIKYLFINGWNIPIENRHTLLYNEFLDRAPGLKK